MKTGFPQALSRGLASFLVTASIQAQTPSPETGRITEFLEVLDVPAKKGIPQKRIPSFGTVDTRSILVLKFKGFGADVIPEPGLYLLTFDLKRRGDDVWIRISPYESEYTRLIEYRTGTELNAMDADPDWCKHLREAVARGIFYLQREEGDIKYFEDRERVVYVNVQDGGTRRVLNPGKDFCDPRYAVLDWLKSFLDTATTNLIEKRLKQDNWSVSSWSGQEIYTLWSERLYVGNSQLTKPAGGDELRINLYRITKRFRSNITAVPEPVGQFLIMYRDFGLGLLINPGVLYATATARFDEERFNFVRTTPSIATNIFATYSGRSISKSVVLNWLLPGIHTSLVSLKEGQDADFSLGMAFMPVPDLRRWISLVLGWRNLRERFWGLSFSPDLGLRTLLSREAPSSPEGARAGEAPAR